MNIYRTNFFCVCPTNNVRVQYTWTIEKQEIIFAEDLLDFLQHVKPEYHENIADKFYAAWGGKQTLEAFHHGVEITTIRGGA